MSNFNGPELGRIIGQLAQINLVTITKARTPALRAYNEGCSPCLKKELSALSGLARRLQRVES
jgi:hypothetical protein